MVKAFDCDGKHGFSFQSREGTIWNSLQSLEKYLLEVLPSNFIEEMIEEEIVLDGEIYLPGHYTVNQINHFVKDPTCMQNKLLQYWCYDIAVTNMIQSERTSFLFSNLSSFSHDFGSKDEHYSNKEHFILLPSFEVGNDAQALSYRNQIIEKGFEGLILRNPNKEYGFGERSSSCMVKYKDHTDGVFKVVDIYPEGSKRQDIPLLLCQNDINNELFEVHINGTQEYQSYVLAHKDNFIGKDLYVSFGERSGVNKVPFHPKEVRFIGNDQ